MDIKQSSATNALIFLLVSSTDHITGLTAAASLVVTISKNGSAFAAPTGAVSEIGNGWYKVAPNATDTNTIGELALHATATGADPTDRIVGNVVAYDPTDAVHLGLSSLPNAAAAALGGLPTVDATNSIKVQSNLKKNSPLLNFSFTMTDSTTHNPKPLVSPVNVTRKLDNGVHSVGTLSAVTEVGNGEYRVDFGSGDMNGNMVVFRATGSGCDDLEATIVTVP